MVSPEGKNFFLDNIQIMDKLPVVVLAGGKIERDLTSIGNVSSKGFLRLNEKYMVEYVIDALRSSESVREIILVVPPGDIPHEISGKIDRIAESGKTIIESLSNGLASLKNAGSTLVVPCDLVLLNADILEDFLKKCEEKNLDLGYAFVPEEVHQNEYARIRHTYVSLKEGRFCGGGLFYVRPDIVPAFKKLFGEILNLRKKPWLISRFFGLKFVLKLLLGGLGMRLLAIKEIEEKISALLGIKAGGILLGDPAAAANIDKLEDFFVMEEILRIKNVGF